MPTRKNNPLKKSAKAKRLKKRAAARGRRKSKTPAARSSRQTLSTQVPLLAGVVEWLPVALFCKDYSDGVGRFVLWNHAAQVLWGLSSKDALGKSDFDFFPVEQALLFQERDRQTLEKGELIFTEQEVVDSPAGRRIVSTWKVPVKNGNSKMPLLLGISLDITERSELEKQLEWEHAKRIESSRLASLGEMAAGIAHEINNPLTIISGVGARLKRQIDKKNFSIDECNRDLGLLTSTVERIVRIIRGLKTIAHAGPSETLSVVSLRELLQDTLEFCRERFRLANVDVRISIGEEIQLACRPALISQVLINLLNNAYDAIAETPQAWVEIACAQRGGEVEISVTDSGNGIPVEISKKIMEPFFTTKGVGRGTGLGLSISKDIVESHGGRLVLDMTSEHTRFSVFLPQEVDSKSLDEAA